MNCATHSENEATAFCRSCGRALCAVCLQDQQGVPHCEVCRAKDEGAQEAFEAGARWRRENPERDSVAATFTATASSVPAPSVVRTPPNRAEAPSPFLALILGLVPGVGAVYNGQYAKAVCHVVIFGGIVTLVGSGNVEGLEPLFVMLAIMFFLYMPIESYRTARALKQGEQVDEFSGLLSLLFAGSRSPVAGVVLIGIGVVFLLQSLGYWRIRDLLPYWPLSLIGLGIYMLYRQLSASPWHDDGGGHPHRRFGKETTRQSLDLGERAQTPTDTQFIPDTDDPAIEPEPLEAVRRTNV